MSTTPDAARLESSNRLLAALPAEASARLRPHLARVQLGLKDVLHDPDASIQDVYFPLTAVGSLLSVEDDGRAVEVGTVGNEGMVGLPVFLGADRTPGLAFSQVPGGALRMPAAAFAEEARPEGPFR